MQHLLIPGKDHEHLGPHTGPCPQSDVLHWFQSCRVNEEASVAEVSEVGSDLSKKFHKSGWVLQQENIFYIRMNISQIFRVKWGTVHQQQDLE